MQRGKEQMGSRPAKALRLRNLQITSTPCAPYASSITTPPRLVRLCCRADLFCLHFFIGLSKHGIHAILIVETCLLNTLAEGGILNLSLIMLQARTAGQSWSLPLKMPKQRRSGSKGKQGKKVGTSHCFMSSSISSSCLHFLSCKLRLHRTQG